MLEQPPLSLYIHIPWCIKKCPYCDFNSHQVNGSFEEDKYTNKLYDDFLVELNRLGDKNRELQSIFIGGGTPSLFKGDSFHFLFTLHLNSKELVTRSATRLDWVWLKASSLVQ